jgi:hypothetical protein
LYLSLLAALQFLQTRLGQIQFLDNDLNGHAKAEVRCQNVLAFFIHAYINRATG